MGPLDKDNVALPKALLNANAGYVEDGTMERGDMLMHFGMETSMTEDMGIFSAEEDSNFEAPHLM